MNDVDPVRDLELLFRSRYGIVHVDSDEDERIETLLRVLADRMGVALFLWTRSSGLKRDGADAAAYGTSDVAQALAHVERGAIDALYYFRDAASILEQPGIAERLRDAAGGLGQRTGGMVVSGSGLELPESLRRMCAHVSLPPPRTDDYRTLVEHVVRDLRASMDVEVAIDAADARRLIHSLQGLTLLEAEKVITRAIVEDGRLSGDDLQHVLDAKRDIVERSGVLEYYPHEESIDEIAGLDGLKDWLRKRSRIIREPERAREFGLEFPKGILLVGVPGCGKSLCARAVAAEWGLPLLRLDPGALYNKYVGESERNFRRACDAAERLAPCVLFIDELEKAFASGDSDGGLSQRVLGAFLTWLQERRGDVFTVATANDVSRLPPEFLRKGRFDEVFFVDLPDAATRAAILAIHLSRRGQAPAGYDLESLAAAAEGFSGAELEQVVVAALYTVFNDGTTLDDAALRREIDATRPLSVVMAERIASLRAWADGRTVNAG